jgi:phage I-like protein
MTYISKNTASVYHTALNHERSSASMLPRHTVHPEHKSNNQDHELSTALCFELPSNGQIPEWVELIPAGPKINGRDGRHWFMRDPQSVLDQSLNQQRDIVGDYEHSTELKSPIGEEAPAAFWVKQLEVRNGALWGRLEWTPKGEASIRNKEYRYLSPVFDFHAKTLEIYRLKNVGLTNNHNLYLSALNHQQHNSTEEKPMLLSEAIRAALALNEGATEAEAVTLITARNQELQTAQNHAQNPPLDKFVPAGDYTTALNRAQTAEATLKENLATALNQEITTLVDQAIKDGKVSPATRKYHVTAMNQDKGIENFKTFLGTAPVIAGASGLDGKDADKENQTALNAEEKQVDAMFGNSLEDITKFGKA